MSQPGLLALGTHAAERVVYEVKVKRERWHLAEIRRPTDTAHPRLLLCWRSTPAATRCQVFFEKWDDTVAQFFGTGPRYLSDQCSSPSRSPALSMRR